MFLLQIRGLRVQTRPMEFLSQSSTSLKSTVSSDLSYLASDSENDELNGGEKVIRNYLPHFKMSTRTILLKQQQFEKLLVFTVTKSIYDAGNTSNDL